MTVPITATNIPPGMDSLTLEIAGKLPSATHALLRHFGSQTAPGATVSLAASLPDQFYSGFVVEKRLRFTSTLVDRYINRARHYTTLPPAQSWNVAEYGIISELDAPDLSEIARPELKFVVGDYTPDGSATTGTCVLTALSWQRADYETAGWVAVGAPALGSHSFRLPELPPDLAEYPPAIGDKILNVAAEHALIPGNSPSSCLDSGYTVVPGEFESFDSVYSMQVE